MRRSIVATLLIVGLLVVTATSIYVIFFTPRAQAERLAQRVMQSAYEQNEAVFRQYGDPSDEFYAAANQRNYRLDSLVEQDATFFIRYTFTDPQSPTHARITIRNAQVVQLVAGNTIGKAPRDDRTEAADTTDSSDFCLEETDLEPLDANRLYARTIRGATMIFGNDNSIDYVDTVQSNTLLDRMATFYTASSEKDFSFLLRGYLPATSEQLEIQRQIVDNRTTKIQQDLIDRGIPRDRTNIGTPIAYDASLADKSNNSRYIVIDVINSCVD